MASHGAELGARLRDGDLTAAPAALNLVENRSPAAREEISALLRAVSPAALGGEARAHVVGVTGPPGAGKSTLLGDRARIAFDPEDAGVFIRSTAAGERLGGLAPATRAAAHALAAAFDVVVVETVGVGQSETEIAEVADSVAVVVQPGSGDVLQFLKAGIMEIPDVLVVTKSDLGDVALRARRDLNAALRSIGEHDTSVVAVSSVPPVQGIDALVEALDAHRAGLDLERRRLAARRASALADFVAEHGERGLRALGGRRAASRWLASQDAGADVPSLTAALEAEAVGR